LNITSLIDNEATCSLIVFQRRQLQCLALGDKTSCAGFEDAQAHFVRISEQVFLLQNKSKFA